MIWYKCLNCGKGFNSDTLDNCPDCGTPKQIGAVSPTHLTKKQPVKSEELEIAVRELIDQKLSEYDNEHLEDYEHKAKEVSTEEIEQE